VEEMGRLKVERVLSRELGKRRFFLSPPEPPPSFLLSNPSDSVYIGRTKLLNVPVCWDYKKLTNPHIAVMGITGSGKSYFVKTFLTRASLVWGTNALIIDWAGEYRPWIEQVGGKVISLGKGDGINLLDLGGMKPSDRIKQILTSFSILTDIGNHKGQLRFLELALEKAYEKSGFDLSKIRPLRKEINSKA
jgi:DNA helicase HerA-like ATPase